MSREYELAFRMNAELDAKFNRVFTSASDRIGQLERKLKGLDNVGGSAGGFGKGIVNSLTNIGKAAAAASGVALAGGIFAAGYALKSSTEKAMDFESQMSSIEALTGATNGEMSKMQALALKMGAATKYSALEAAQGIEELLKAGLTPATVQAGGLEAALNLATAGSLDLASAAEIMSTALNAYKKDGMTAADASNILAGTANASATSVEELRYSLAAVSAVAAGVGLDFEDTNIALGLFANNGLKGSDAGTSLKTMLQNLQPTTKEQTALFKKLGLMTANGSNAFYDSAGNIKSLDEISGTLQKSMKNLTNQQRALYFETLFGSDAIRAANILYEEGAEGVKKFQKEMSKVTALDVARKKMDNAAGAVEQFKGAIETLQISALLPTMPIIKNLANAAADFVADYTPQITAAMERMVGKAENFFKTHFTNNPEFKQIPTLDGKIAFVFEDLWDTFQGWLNSGGQEKINNVTTRMMEGFAEMIKLGTPVLTEAAIGLGKSIGETIVTAINNTLSSDPIAAAILGGVIGGAAGSVAGPVGAAGGAVLGAAAGVGQHYTSKFSDWAKDRYTDMLDSLPKAGSSWGGKVADVLSFGGVSRANGYAEGGFVDRPELAWVGEGRYPEWIIPQNDSERSRSLWQAAGRSIGALPKTQSGGAGDFNFKPTYNFYGNADQAAVRQMEQRTRSDFAAEFEAWKTQQRRLAFQ